jgi:hypothetical protein
MSSCVSRPVGLLALGAWLLSGPVAAQEAPGPPPAPSGGGDAGPYVHELLCSPTSAAYVAHLAGGAGPAAALAGPPSAPFPVTRSVRTWLRLLQLSPFSLKYTVLRLDHSRLCPYASAGLDYVVVITRETRQRDESLLFRGQHRRTRTAACAELRPWLPLVADAAGAPF